MATTAFFLLIIAVIASSNLIHSYALNTILTNKSIRDGETLISAGGDFELGFFSPADSSSRYVGIWYKKLAVHTVIWVANREAPLHDSLGTLNLTHHGLLVLYNSTNHIVWSSNTSATAQDPTAELLNSGNLVVRNRRDESSKSLWQSFDYPCNSWIVGMRLGIDLETGFQRYLSSWKSNENPAKGEYSFAVYQTPQGYPQLVVKRGSNITFRFGSWNGVELTGVARPNRNFLVPIEYIFNEKEITFHFIPIVNSSILLRYEINPFGLVHRLIWDDRIQDWYTSNFVQGDQCAVYAFCGAFGICNVQSSPVCKCFDGFIANSTTNQSIVGCVRRMPLNCSDTDGFIKHAKVKLPDTSSSWYDQRIGLDECQRLCLRNCSCTAYANLDIRGTGCLMWFDDLIDVTVLNMEGQDLYVRVAASELGNRGSPNKKKLALIFTSLFLTVAMLITLLIIYTRYQRKRGNLKEDIIENDNDKERKEDIDSPLFDLTVIVEATNNFSSNNKLGEGGFGPVYKGVLVDGQEIAVKRLSKSSGQGLSEFKNEVILIAKLQHRNLVKLLGCCIHGDEKILIYEYMPNKSLDSFIFDQHRRKLLNWGMRFCIINGIARGILYLHQDSRLRVIHRDLKASNILLDKEMNPKISDFGLARTFGGDQSHANTSRIVGTYGYMSPEYAIDGLFSIKSDVFSFGVIVLEIINGQKNRGFSHPDHGLNLLGHAWTLCTEGRAINLLDECLKESSIVLEVIRCIHIALLCVQQRPEDRPTMSSVVMMLSRDFQLAEPKHPGYFLERDPPSVDTLSNINSTHSVDIVSITSLQAR